jgi:hypothetical protein
LGRARISIPALASIRPRVELIGLACLFDISVKRIRAAERAHLAGVQCVGLSIAGSLSVAVTHCNHGVCAILARLQAVASWLGDGEGQVRRVDFEVIVGIQVPHSHVDLAGTQLQLDGLIIEIQKGDSGICRQSNYSCAQLEFRARVFVGPNFVADRHWPVLYGFDPIGFTGRLKRDRAFHITETRHAPRWVRVLILCRSLQSEREHGDNERQDYAH